MLLLCRAVNVSADCPLETIQGLSPHNCYAVEFQLVTWAKAESLCSSKGGHLASVQNAFTNTFFTQSMPFADDIKAYWIGGFRNSTAGNWSWSDGRQWKYTNWPQGHASGNCVQFTAATGEWSPVKCDTQMPSLCSVPQLTMVRNSTKPSLPPSLPTAAPQKKGERCPPAWVAIASSDLCYLSPQTPASGWSDASAVCQAHGGQLASIPNAAVNNELLDTFPTCSFTLCYIGLRSDDDGYFSGWTDGTPLNYTNWVETPLPGDVYYVYLNAIGSWGCTDVDDFENNKICELAPSY